MSWSRRDSRGAHDLALLLVQGAEPLARALLPQVLHGGEALSVEDFEKVRRALRCDRNCLDMPAGSPCFCGRNRALEALDRIEAHVQELERELADARVEVRT